MFDSVYVFAIGLQTLEQSHSLTLLNISCEEENSWDGGLSLINYLNAVSLTANKGLNKKQHFIKNSDITFFSLFRRPSKWFITTDFVS